MISKKFQLLYVISFAILFLANSGGVSDDRTASPRANGATCDGCHTGGSFDAKLNLTGIPSKGIKNLDTLKLKLEVSDATSRGAGFQIVALDTKSEVYAGKWIAGIGSKLINNNGIGLSHNATRGWVNGKGDWSFQWIAPATGGPFTFYYVVNFVNSNGSTSGDNPITGNTNVLLPVNELSRLELDYRYNPNGKEIFLQHSNSDIAKLSATIYDQQGRAVVDIKSTERMDVSNLANGIYFIKINTASNAVTKKILIY
jgi:hypothetical protein